MQLSRGVSLSSAFCLWHGHCAVAHWLKDTLISSLGIWHVFSKEGPPPTHFVHPHTHCWPSFRMPLTVSRRMICGMISATTCWPATDLWWQLGSSRTACFTASVWFLWPPPPHPPVFGDSMHLPKYYLPVSQLSTVAQRWSFLLDLADDKRRRL